MDTGSLARRTLQRLEDHDPTGIVGFAVRTIGTIAERLVPWPSFHLEDFARAFDTLDPNDLGDFR